MKGFVLLAGDVDWNDWESDGWNDWKSDEWNDWKSDEWNGWESDGWNEWRLYIYLVWLLDKKCIYD